MRHPLSRVLLAVSGSSAASQADALVDGFLHEGIGVTVILTPRAHTFVPELAAEVHTDEDWVRAPLHLTLPAQADAFVVAPATCNTIAKAACGIADNLALASITAWGKEVIFFPGMNRSMWDYAGTKGNVKRLHSLGHFVAQPLDSVAESTGRVGDAVGWSPEYVVSTTIHRSHLALLGVQPR
ncbi:flavoprotein [Streptomyces sp. ATCC 21386]|uniref:flavoprotein n=1 Tax=Streptomyces sp. ATCC 21386 TaxID=2699428 RepID=UPI002044D9C9|nr:flavoprotein [Streptomyces sp. ATCC 21386]